MGQPTSACANLLDMVVTSPHWIGALWLVAGPLAGYDTALGAGLVAPGRISGGPSRLKTAYLAAPDDVLLMVEQSFQALMAQGIMAVERITLTDRKGRRHSVVLAAGGAFHTTKGGVRHDDLIGRPEGVVVTSAGGTEFLALRPLLSEFTVTSGRMTSTSRRRARAPARWRHRPSRW